jgi:uncharacterized cupin superfamily protein
MARTRSASRALCRRPTPAAAAGAQGDGPEEILRPGDCAAFKAGDPDGHHLVNRSDRPAKVLEIGNSDPRDRCVYSDIDMVAGPGTAGYSHRNGVPYPVKAQ